MNAAKATTLEQIKLQMAEKYERLARSTRSDPKRKQFQYRASRHRRQAAEFARIREQRLNEASD